MFIYQIQTRIGRNYRNAILSSKKQKISSFCMENTVSNATEILLKINVCITKKSLLCKNFGYKQGIRVYAKMALLKNL